MAHLIDKSALVAEIENKINKYTKRGEESDAKRDGYGMFWGGVVSCLNEVRTLCDTLEVKEVDLKDEVERFAKECGYNSAATIDFQFAKHFFELEVKAQKGEEV